MGAPSAYFVVVSERILSSRSGVLLLVGGVSICTSRGASSKPHEDLTGPGGTRDEFALSENLTHD